MKGYAAILGLALVIAPRRVDLPLFVCVCVCVCSSADCLLFILLGIIGWLFKVLC